MGRKNTRKQARDEPVATENSSETISAAEKVSSQAGSQSNALPQQPPAQNSEDQQSAAKVKADKVDKGDKKKESKKNKKERKKKTVKKKASDLSAKEIELIKVAHTSITEALGSDMAQVTEEDKKVLQQLEKLKKQMDDGKAISMNLLKIAKDLFAEKNRQEKAAKEAEIKRKRDLKNEEKQQIKREQEIKEKNGQEKSTAA